MAATSLAAFPVKACFALVVAFLASLVSAQDASINPQDLTDYFAQWKMTLVIETAANAPYGSPFDVVPLTIEAGLQQSEVSKLPDINGDLVILDYTNFTHINYTEKVVFLSCDASTAGNDSNMITPDDMLNSIMNNSESPNAILLYSTAKPICFLGGSHLTYTHVWTMASQDDAVKVRSVLTATSTDPVVASITPNVKAVDSQQPQTGNTSAIAMSILYSITGLITLLFLLIIATGAVRAHRNPERYGPRAGVNGRPRRSRARGLAMAMLETLPIVKFGENDERKPDEETALENTSRAQSQPQDGSQGVVESTSNNNAAPESSSEAANNSHNTPHEEPEIVPAPTGATPDKAKTEPKPEEENPGCSICTEDFTVGEDVRVLPCNHKFHPACVDPWLVNVSGTCPLCRLDLRPPEDIEREENEAAAAAQDAATATTAPAQGHLAPPAETDQAAAGETSHRRRRSRLLDWNRLRHASVDERLQALRQYRQSQQGSDGADDERRHSRLTDRLRERFHIRSESRSNAATPAPAPAPVEPERSIPVGTIQH
ncbi:RING-7 protein [Xylaria flabelliformis]|nr:RING-7 protein [Xylaria flabelliformis]